MLTFPDRKQAGFCDRLSRRDFLRVGALGVGGLTLPDLLRGRALAKQGANVPRSRAVIMVCLSGGPSHIDMYDLKPEAPSEYRGEFKPIQSNVPGMQLCELFPLQATIADKLAIIRNMRFRQQGHNPPELLTGFLSGPRPDLGAVVSKLRQDAGLLAPLPPYVALGIESYPGFLGNAHKPFVPADRQNRQSNNLELVRGVTREQLEDRKRLLRVFDNLHREMDDARGNLAGMDAFQLQALEMISTRKARDAFDINQEPEAVRAKYGKSTKFLQARRLVEAGVPIVTMTFFNPDPVPQGLNPGWDHHDHIYRCLRPLLPHLDRGIHALVTDLWERGLNDDVAVCLWGEMGRTPRIGTQRGTTAGRDHWPQAGFCLIAGGGLQMGQVIGATDARAENPRGLPYTPQNVLATLYHVLGIDPDQTTIPDHQGRPIHLLDDTQKVKELV